MPSIFGRDQGTLRQHCLGATGESPIFPSGVGTTPTATDSSVIFWACRQNYDTTSERGCEAEALAARHLEQAGLQIVERNFSGPWREIDLICRDGRSLVFVEVRLRKIIILVAPPALPPPSADGSFSPHSITLLGKADCDCRFGASLWMRLMRKVTNLAEMLFNDD